MAELTRSIGTGEDFEKGDFLVEKLRAGDEDAFAEVFILYKDMVYTLAVKLVADKAEAMDVTQEVFLSLFRKIRGFRGECSLKTWLYRVAVNQAANRNRWWKRRFRNRTVSLHLDSSREIAKQIDPVGSNPSPARICFSRELREALQAALRRLPFEQRVAVVLRDVDGLTYEEIAEINDVRIGTVKSRIARARERLRGYLSEFQGNSKL